jgi:glycosyltransferase involved in cell wall biosynthesis
METHIVLLNTAHASFDDRVFYHQAKSLSEKAYRVSIVSTTETIETVRNAVNICSHNLNALPKQRERHKKMVEVLTQLNPDIIICDTPMAVLAADKYSKTHKTKIIYDITEWYPSANNLRHFKGLKKWLRCVLLLFLNLYAGGLTDGFIFGEHFKSRPFRFFYFWKPFLFLSYFPDLDYIHSLPIQNIKQCIRLFYGGSLHPKRGLPNVITSITTAADEKKDVVFDCCFVCHVSAEKDKLYFEKLTKDLPPNVKIHLNSLLSFPDFCQYILNMDLFFDLRTMSFESNHSLPIKLFYYLACGRPIIYSRLKSITAFFPDISFGYLVNPSDTTAIADKIVHYINNQDVYVEHCRNALKLSKEKYCWKKIENSFIQFVQQFQR